MKQPHVHAGLEIGSTDCPGCGAPVPLKINVNGCVYYYCAATIAHDEKGKATRRCKTRFSMNQEASARILNDFLEKEKNDVPEIHHREETGNIAGNDDKFNDTGGDSQGEQSGDQTRRKSIGAALFGAIIG